MKVAEIVSEMNGMFIYLTTAFIIVRMLEVIFLIFFQTTESLTFAR